MTHVILYTFRNPVDQLLTILYENIYLKNCLNPKLKIRDSSFVNVYEKSEIIINNYKYNIIRFTDISI